MAAERGLFTIEDALDAINRKLVRRHPHVFGEESARTADDVKRIWGEVKAAEKARQTESQAGSHAAGLLDGVPRAMPALVEAQQIASRAAAAGFWRRRGAPGRTTPSKTNWAICCSSW